MILLRIMSQGLCWVPPPPTGVRACAHVYTHVRSFRIPCEHVIQVRCCLPVTTTSPRGHRPSLLQGPTFPELCPQGSGGDDSAPAPPSVANQNPFLGLSLEVLGTGTFPRWLSKARSCSWSCRQPSTTPRVEPPTGGTSPRSRGSQRLEEVCLDSSSGSLQIQLFLKPALPCTCQLKRSIASPWAGVSFN